MEASPQIRFGPAGWSYKDWDGVFYPPGMQRRKEHPLEYLSRCFDMVEINTSFYGHIRPELAKIWGRKVSANPEFRFTAKLHRSFTHSPIAVMEPTSAATIRPNEQDERLAREGLDALAQTGKFGALLIQFPASFKNTSLNREYIETLIRQFIEYPRVIEVRHSTWDNADTIRYFEQKNVSFCNIDQPQIGYSLAPTEHVTSPVGYVRLHGRNYDQWFESDSRNDRYNYLYAESELQGWKEKIGRIAGKAEVTYVVTNNHFEAKAAVNALQLKHMVTGRKGRATTTLMQRYPELKQIAEVLPDNSSNADLPLLA
ncbi:MAG TPA: DUF72 domain-containing protein [Terriglobales bacterium]|nr:DUF72 domain-containing protein [Terriglobales bacterium]